MGNTKSVGGKNLAASEHEHLDWEPTSLEVGADAHGGWRADKHDDSIQQQSLRDTQELQDHKSLNDDDGKNQVGADAHGGWRADKHDGSIQQQSIRVTQEFQNQKNVNDNEGKNQWDTEAHAGKHPGQNPWNLDDSKPREWANELDHEKIEVGADAHGIWRADTFKQNLDLITIDFSKS